MIGRVYRGPKVSGLVRYLYGPGRHNEHVDQRLVASWAGSDPRVLAQLEPEVTERGLLDFRGLIAELEAPAAYAERLDRRPVWHCPLRTAPGDRTLTDSEWAGVAEDLMHRTGIAPRGDDGACRWIAVRHDEESIHVVALLARQDGGPARLSNDWHRVRETCLAAESTFGLSVTAPADRTAATHTSRAETEKAARAGQRMPDRDWLRAEVQHAATASRGTGEFLDRLRVAGVVVRERQDPRDGKVTGYAVGRADPGGDQPPVLFGGGKLAPDLSLPRLQARWARAGTDAGAEPVSRAEVWDRAIDAAASAAEAVRAQHLENPDGAGDAAAAAADVLGAAGRLLEGEAGGPLTQAAQDYDRAARERYGRAPEPSHVGSLLRVAALQMARASQQAGGQDAARAALLITQIARLAAAVSRLREAQERAGQAAAARRTATGLRNAASAWDSVASDFARERATLGSAIARRPSGTSLTPRSQGPRI